MVAVAVVARFKIGAGIRAGVVHAAAAKPPMSK